MRAIWSVFLLAALIVPSAAQDPAVKPDGDAPKKDPQPKEAPAWKMPEKEYKRVEDFLEDYLGGKKNRRDVLAKFQKYVDKPVGDHSVLEDVAALSGMASHARAFGKLGRDGKINEVAVPPDVHGFPGSVGTVKYLLYLPKNYDSRKHLSPVIFCLPDNRVWHDGAKYIEEAWLTSQKVADDYLVVVPRPQAKGDSWSAPKSVARAMITLRHVLGTFDADPKTAGPASDPDRVFIDGQDPAAVVAGRFPELFRGAILRNTDGRLGGRIDLQKAGGLAMLPGYFICAPKKKRQKEFAQKVREENAATLILETEDAKMLMPSDGITNWMEGLAPNPQPREIQYSIHEPSFQRHHWINVLQYDASVQPAASFRAVADRATNVIRIESNGLTRFEVFLNDAIVDLNQKLRIVIVEDGKEMEFSNDMVSRSLAKMLEEIVASNHPSRIYPARLEIDLPALREKQARIDAAAKEAAAKKNGAQKNGVGASMGGGEPQK